MGTVATGALVAATATGGLAATGNMPGQADDPDPVITVVDDSDDAVEADDTCDTTDTAASGTCDDLAGTVGDDDDACEEGDEACDEAAAGAVEPPEVDADGDEVDPSDEVDASDEGGNAPPRGEARG